GAASSTDRRAKGISRNVALPATPLNVVPATADQWPTAKGKLVQKPRGNGGGSWTAASPQRSRRFHVGDVFAPCIDPVQMRQGTTSRPKKITLHSAESGA